MNNLISSCDHHAINLQHWLKEDAKTMNPKVSKIISTYYGERKIINFSINYNAKNMSDLIKNLVFGNYATLRMLVFFYHLRLMIEHNSLGYYED